MSRSQQLAAGMVVLLLGLVTVGVWTYREQLAELTVGVATTRLAWGFARSQLGIPPRPRYSGGEGHVSTIARAVQAAGVVAIALGLRRTDTARTANTPGSESESGR